MQKLMSARALARLGAIVVLTVLLIPLGQGLGAGWVTEQVTDNTYDDRDPQISGDNVVWRGHDGHDYEIVLYDGSTVTTLTDNAFDDRDPQISGDKVVWRGHDGHDYEIVLYDGSTVTTLTDNAFDNLDAEISGDNVVWRGHDGHDYEIVLYDGSTVTTLTDNGYHDFDPQVSGDNVVWRGHDGDDHEIFFYNGSMVTTLTDNAYEDYGPQISGDNVVWTGWDGSDYELVFYNGSTVTTLTDNGYSDNSPQVSGDNVVWRGDAPGDDEIFFYNGSTVTTLTDNGYSDTDPKISGDNVVWAGDARRDYEIFFYNGSTVTTLTDNGDDDHAPQVSGNHVVWWGEASGDDDVFLARLDSKKPTVRMANPFVSTRISKTTTFKVKWWAEDDLSGIDNYTVRYRPSTSSTWRIWKSNTTATEDYFTGKAGVTYYFRTYAYDNAGNKGWSKVYKTVVPFNEGTSVLRRIGFNGFKKLGKSQNYLTSVRYSYTRGHTLVYKLHNTNGIGLVVTKGPEMGLAKIYVDGKRVTTVDAYKSSMKARQLIYYKGFKKRGTHWLKVVNLGTPGRAKFEIDGVVLKR